MISPCIFDLYNLNIFECVCVCVCVCVVARFFYLKVKRKDNGCCKVKELAISKLAYKSAKIIALVYKEMAR